MSYGVYIATSWHNKPAWHEAAALLPSPWYITCDWTDEDESSDPAWIAKRDFDGIRRADVVIVLLPGRLGTHTEMGYALGLGKRVILVGDPWPSDLVFPGSPFYFLDGVTRVATIPEAMKRLNRVRELLGQ
jgi:hypothetical protein